MTGRVLVVEDEGIIAADISDCLRDHGYDVVGVCRDGEDAVRRALDLLPDVVVMDIHLGGALDGAAAARRIREESDPAIVYLTAYADRETFEAAQEAGPYGYLVKPFEDETLRTTVETALRRRSRDEQNARRLRLQDAALETLSEGVLVVDAEGGVERANAAAQDLLGSTPTSIVEVGAEEDGSTGSEAWQRLLERSPRRWRLGGRVVMASAERVGDAVVVVLTPGRDEAEHRRRTRVTVENLRQRARQLI